jgi:predicted deacylase
MLDGKPGATAASQNTYIGRQSQSIRASVGGYAEVLVALNQDVRTGQLVAVQRNGFGDIIARYTAPFDARVSSIGTDPIREPGSMLVRLIRDSQESTCRDGC